MQCRILLLLITGVVLTVGHAAWGQTNADQLRRIEALEIRLLLLEQKYDRLQRSIAGLPAALNFWQLQQSVVTVRTASAQGSGFLIDSGLPVGQVVVTNFHVVRGARKVTIRFFDGAGIDLTECLCYSQDDDIALFALPDREAKYRPLRLSQDAANTGRPVYALGAPLGLTGTVTGGIVSSHRGSFSSGRSQTTIQHDAATSPGSSGGPLLDENGLVVGVNTLSIGAEDAQNLNIATPSHRLGELLSAGWTVSEPLELLASRPTAPQTAPPETADILPAMRLLNAGELSAAIEFLNSVPSNERGPAFWRSRSRLMFELGDFRDVVECIHASTHLGANDAELWADLAAALRLESLNNIPDIHDACRRSLELEPENGRAMFVLASTTLKNEDAIPLLERVLKLDPSHLGAWYELASRTARDDEAKAIGLYESALKLAADLDGYHLLAERSDQESFLAGHSAYSRREFTSLLKRYSSRGSFKTLLLLHLAAACSGEQKLRYAEAVLKDEPGNKFAKWYALGAVDRRLALAFSESLSIDEVLNHAALSSGTLPILILKRRSDPDEK